MAESFVRFISSSSESYNPVASDVNGLTGATGDSWLVMFSILFLIIGIITLGYYAYKRKTSIVTGRKTAFLLPIALIGVAISFLLFTFMSTSMIFANEDNNTEVFSNDIVCVVDDSGNIQTGEGTISNYGQDSTLIDSSSLKLVTNDSRLVDCSWLFTSNGKVLFNGKASSEGTEYVLNEKVAVSKEGTQIPVSLKISGIDGDTAKSLISKNVVKLEYNYKAEADYEYKENAKKDIDNSSDSAKKAIDDSDVLTPEEKEKAKEEIDKQAEEAKKKIDESETKEDVDKAKEEFEHNCVAELANIIQEKLIVQKDNTNDSINKISGLTDEDKARFKEIINNYYIEYKDKISNATSFEEIITYYTEALDKFNQTVNEATELGKAKEDGKKEIDDKFDDVIKDIDDKKNLTDEEKEEYKKKAEEERDKAKDTIDDSKEKKEVDDAVDDGKKKADEISDEVDKKDKESTWTINFEVVKQSAKPIPETQHVKYNGFVSQPEESANPELEGYKFLGWCKDVECTIYWQFNSDRVGIGVTSNDCTQTLYAKWEPIKSTILLNAPEATTPGTDKVTGIYGEELPAIQLPEKKGTSFLGYFDTGGKQYYTAKGAGLIWDKEDANVTLTASFGERYCVVKFDSDYGEESKLEPQNVKYNTLATEVVLTETGYTFEGWYTDKSFSAEKKWDFSTNVVDDMTLYAKWTVNKTDVTLDNQGGSELPKLIQATYNQILPTVTPPTRIGWVFDGYYSEVEGAGDKYISSDGTTTGKVWEIDASTYTLYANWIPEKYTIKFDFNDPTTVGKPETAEAEYMQLIPDCVESTPTREGYTFLGYFDTKTGTDKYYDKDGKPVENKKWEKAADGVLYAQWEGNSSEVTLSAVGSSIETQIVQADYGKLIDTSGLTAPTKEGESFKGFYDSVSGGTQYINYKMEGTKTWDKNKDTTLYAQWGTIDYIATFEMNGHGTQVAAQNKSYGDYVTEPSPAPSEENYKFLGWYKDKECTTGNEWKFDSETITNNVTLYAKWEEKLSPNLTLSQTSITSLEIKSAVTITATVDGSCDVKTVTGTTPGETGMVSVEEKENNTFVITGDKAGKSPYVDFYVEETDDYKSQSIRLTIGSVNLKTRGNIEIIDSSGNADNIVLNVPYFSDGYYLNVNYEYGDANDTAHWNSSSVNLASSYNEEVEAGESGGWTNKCILIGITPQTDTATYTMTATIEATDEYAEATATAGVKVTPRDRNIEITSDSPYAQDPLMLELDNSIIATEKHHGYHGDTTENNTATWTVIEGEDTIIKMEDTTVDNPTVNDNLNNLFSNESNSVTTDDAVFTSSKKITALKSGTAKIKITIPKADSNKYDAVDKIYTVTVDKHDPTDQITMTNTVNMVCYGTETNTFTFNPPTGHTSDNVDLDPNTVTAKIDSKTCSIGVINCTGNTKTISMTTGGNGADLSPIVSFDTIENDRYKKVTLSFVVNIRQNEARTVAINEGNAVTIFTQNTANTKVTAKPVTSTQILTTDLYTFSMTEGADTIAKLISPTSKSTVNIAELKGVAGGTAKLHVVLEDANNNGAETPVPGYKACEADLVINVDYWEYTFTTAGATVTKYVGAETVTESYVDIPNKVTYTAALNDTVANTDYNVIGIGDGTNSVFSGSTYCSKVNIKTGSTTLTNINKSAFASTNLAEISLKEANGLTTINETAFANCSKLTTVTYPDSTTALTTIGKEAFINCSKLTQPTIKSKLVTSIGKDAYKNTEFVNGESSAVYDANNYYILGTDSSNYNAVTENIPVTTLCMADNVFEGLTTLKNVRVGATDNVDNKLTLIVSSNAFKDCTNLQAFVAKGISGNDTITYKTTPFSGCGVSGSGADTKPALMIAGGTNTTALTKVSAGYTNGIIYNYKNAADMGTSPQEGNYYFMQDAISCASQGKVEHSCAVDLNGNSYTRTGDEKSETGNAFLIKGTGITFNLIDSDGNDNGKITNCKTRTDYGGAVSLGNSSNSASSCIFNFYSGAISGNKCEYSVAYNGYGGGVSLYENCSDCTFNMFGGKIQSNSATRGGGVAINAQSGKCVFNMYDGIIGDESKSGTSSSYSNYLSAGAGTDDRLGAGVFISNSNSTMNMYGGKICGNYATKGGTWISSYGGGILLNGGTFNGYGGSIINNGSNDDNKYADLHKKGGTANIDTSKITIGKTNVS